MSCSDSDNCGSCSATYGLTSSGGFDVCTSCTVNNCFLCYANAGNCDTCLSGFRLSGNNCQGCSDSNCQDCSGSSSICINCKTNYGLIGAGCVQCASSHCIFCDGDVNVCTWC